MLRFIGVGPYKDWRRPNGRLGCQGQSEDVSALSVRDLDIEPSAFPNFCFFFESLRSTSTTGFKTIAAYMALLCHILV